MPGKKAAAKITNTKNTSGKMKEGGSRRDNLPGGPVRFFEINLKKGQWFSVILGGPARVWGPPRGPRSPRIRLPPVKAATVLHFPSDSNFFVHVFLTTQPYKISTWILHRFVVGGCTTIGCPQLHQQNLSTVQ